MTADEPIQGVGVSDEPYEETDLSEDEQPPITNADTGDEHTD